MVGNTHPDETVNAGPADSSNALERRILRGIAWLAAGFGSRQVVSWLSMLVLVRLLQPHAFGVMALAFTIVSALHYLRGSGLWAALVYRRERIEDAAASAFVYLAVSSVAVYGICFAVAPLAARAFSASDLTGVLRGLAVLIIFGGLGIVPGAILERDLRYAAVARVDVAGALAQLVVSVGLAVAGVGVWSLVGGQLAAGAAEDALLWLLAPWRPSPTRASWSMLCELFRYGRFAGAANIGGFLSGTLDTVTVGRVLGATSVGFYSVAFRLATTPQSVFAYVVAKAMFPAFSIVREDREAFRRTFVQHALRTTLLVLPVTTFLALAARPTVLSLLGDKWSPVVTPLRILAVFGFVAAISATTSAVFRGAGRPELAMWFTGLNVVLLVPALIVLTKAFELNGAAIAVLGSATCAALPAVGYTLNIVGISAGELLQRLRPALFCSGVLAVFLVLVGRMTSSASPVVALLILLLGGIAVYAASMVVFARNVVVPMWLDLRGTRTQP